MKNVMFLLLTVVSSIVLIGVGLQAIDHSRRARMFGYLSRRERHRIRIQAAILVLGGIAGLAIAAAQAWGMMNG